MNLSHTLHITHTHTHIDTCISAVCAGGSQRAVAPIDLSFSSRCSLSYFVVKIKFKKKKTKNALTSLQLRTAAGLDYEDTRIRGARIGVSGILSVHRYK